MGVFKRVRWITRRLRFVLEGGPVPAELQQYKDKMRRVQADRDSLAIQVDRDGLTGLWNQIAGQREFIREMSGLRRRNNGVGQSDREQLTFIFMDLVGFGAVNDEVGHLESNRVLQAVAHAIQDALERETDFATRLGGDEFGVVLPGTDYEGGMFILERILDNVRSLAITTRYGVVSGLDLHTKLVTSDGMTSDPLGVMDSAGYKAKRSPKKD